MAGPTPVVVATTAAPAFAAATPDAATVAPAAAYPEAATPAPAARVEQNMGSKHQAGRI